MSSIRQRAELQRRIWPIANDDNRSVTGNVGAEDQRTVVDVSWLNTQWKTAVTEIEGDAA